MNNGEKPFWNSIVVQKNNPGSLPASEMQDRQDPFLYGTTAAEHDSLVLLDLFNSLPHSKQIVS